LIHRHHSIANDYGYEHVFAPVKAWHSPATLLHFNQWKARCIKRFPFSKNMDVNMGLSGRMAGNEVLAI